MEYKFTSKNEQDTIELAQNIESEKFPNMVICLNGELGTGKTVFVKGFADSLSITENITSPTFNIVKEYESGEMKLNHMDVYRIDETDQSIDFEDYFNQDAVTIIEWSELIQDKLPDERLDITIKIVNENTRLFVLKPRGHKYEDVVNSVL
jgi:tRNA threonylcarbamoyladenosine biosynthesis protein TsaE